MHIYIYIYIYTHVISTRFPCLFPCPKNPKPEIEIWGQVFRIAPAIEVRHRRHCLPVHPVLRAVERDRGRQSYIAT